ncbi:hypothetical protein BIU92_04345 [Curtobacterium sp. MCBA15_003]|nr:hypothetical protein BIU92_04345 [Curtobacterium sp. MCBA15_003]OII31306.1 hypothetical protein BIU94_04900 [Curtobacterium sp. MMLR14_006]
MVFLAGLATNAVLTGRRTPTDRAGRAVGPETGPAHDPGSVRRFFRSWKVATVAVVLAATALTLVVLIAPNGWVALGFVVVGAFLTVLKELCAAFARDETRKPERRRSAEDVAAICSVYAAVFGVPGLVAAAAPFLTG